MSSDPVILPFSQRNGLLPIPDQLRLGQITSKLRDNLTLAVRREIERGAPTGRFDRSWRTVAEDLHVNFFEQSVLRFDPEVSAVRARLENTFLAEKYWVVFDLVEFLYRHRECTDGLRTDFSRAFLDSHVAYRLIDGLVVAIGTEEVANAVVSAIENSERSGKSAARQHLVKSGHFLRQAEWADSVRESIHAVESVACSIEPTAKTLSDALKTLDKKIIHGGMKEGLSKLYGYTSDQRGIRHSLLEKTSEIDEADAVFMLGACASFVSYLLARAAEIQTKQQD